jgi:hypothetical protein
MRGYLDGPARDDDLLTREDGHACVRAVRYVDHLDADGLLAAAAAAAAAALIWVWVVLEQDARGLGGGDDGQVRLVGLRCDEGRVGVRACAFADGLLEEAADAVHRAVVVVPLREAQLLGTRHERVRDLAESFSH